MNPTIYVACLASYNNGIRYGIEFDATLPPEDMMGIIKDMLENSPVEGAEEWDVCDYNDFGLLNTYRIGGLQHIHDIACFLVEKGELGAGLLKELGENVDEARRVMEDDYIGEYNSIVEYAMERTADCYSDVPDYIMGYIDFEAMASDLSHDLIEIELDGYVYLYHNS